jgi:hypothetical protein
MFIIHRARSVHHIYTNVRFRNSLKAIQSRFAVFAFTADDDRKPAPEKTEDLGLSESRFRLRPGRLSSNTAIPVPVMVDRHTFDRQTVHRCRVDLTHRDIEALQQCDVPLRDHGTLCLAKLHWQFYRGPAAGNGTNLRQRLLPSKIR